MSISAPAMPTIPTLTQTSNQPQLPPNPASGINIDQMKKDFKNLILATVSHARGSAEYESGSKRENSINGKTDTNIDKAHSPFYAMLLHGKNLFTQGFGKKKEKAKLNLEMASAQTYKLFAKYADQFV